MREGRKEKIEKRYERSRGKEEGVRETQQKGLGVHMTVATGLSFITCGGDKHVTIIDFLAVLFSPDSWLVRL